MKIINRKQFLDLPKDTLFSKFQPNVFGDLSIKGDTLYNGDEAIDFFLTDVADPVDCSSSDDLDRKLDIAVKLGSSLNTNYNIEGRDGCYDDNELFAVYERQDVLKLINRLSDCVKTDYKITDRGIETLCKPGPLGLVEVEAVNNGTT